ncbi:MAG: ABC transporter ATP-binding protein [Armatimonadetes bacterium]|nr:ABC transporter ATP-binding protein [Armatimonadota bacterium]
MIGVTAVVLAARNITRRFGTFTALDAVNFAVGEGEIVALLGENGAGKSTLMNVLSGSLAPSDGTILMDDKPVRFASPLDAASRGIGMVHQHFLLVPTLSVAENLLLTASRRAGGALSYNIKGVLKDAQILAGRLGWTIPWQTLTGDLPVGTQQRVEILQALRGQTRVLIFDEPTAVLSPTETPELFATIRRLSDEGRGIVFISHKLDEVLALSHRVVVLRRGKVVFTGETRNLDERILAEAMVGADSDAAVLLQAPPGVTTTAAPESAVAKKALHVEAVTVRVRGASKAGETKSGAGTAPLLPTALDAVTFAVEPGEIFGIAGVDGNGQEELAAVLSGLMRPASGTVQIGGVAPPVNAAAFRRAGVAVIPADRQARGLAMPLTLAENVALGVYDSPEYRVGAVLKWRKLRERADALVKRFDIRGGGVNTSVLALSGGNQQKVVIARALSGSPRVIIAVNPTRGLDVGAIAYVHNALRQARDNGAAVVLISTELSEIQSLSTRRVAVLFAGKIAGIVAPDASRETFGLLMGGKRLKETTAVA